ncbi:hypothetical protein [Taibaiella helva]|uniref:hypothetical protein n=1 Tax=Taibaiella helva TaxID=2301235 RepID=UPI0013007E28|nr:hypothetical protein [Taibaiella helva]
MKTREMEHIVRTGSFAEAEEQEIAYYASINWKESVAVAEELRRSIWSEAYRNREQVAHIVKKAVLTDRQDDIE